MISIFFGSAESAARVRQAARDHAGWLGRPISEADGPSGAEVRAYVAWDPETSDDQYRYLAVCRREDNCRYADRQGDDSARVRLHAVLEPAGLTVEVPLTAVSQLQHVRLPGGWLLTDDLRLLRRLPNPELDPLGVYALLKFGTIPAPHSLLKGVTRVTPGYRYRYDASGTVVDEQHVFGELVERALATAPPASLDEARERVLAPIDRALSHLPSGSSVLFSGGVDSSLIAARLADQGRTDVKLAHVELDYEPEETRVARTIADQLGLELQRRTFEPGHAEHVLRRVGREWPFPFHDPAVVPTHFALTFALSLGGSATTDGTGGAFLSGSKIKRWQRRGRLIGPLGGVIAGTAARLGMWRSGGRQEQLLRVAGRDQQLSPVARLVVQNVLDGLAYRVPRDELEVLDQAMNHPLAALPGGPQGVERLAMARLLMNATSRFAVKLLGPLSLQGASCLNPFLAPAYTEAELAARGEWIFETSKPTFKSELARRGIPRELVYRGKSHFTPRIDDVISLPEVRQAVEQAISAGQPLAGYVEPRPVRRLLQEGRQRAESGTGSISRNRRWLWTLAFTERWLSDTEFGPL